MSEFLFLFKGGIPDNPDIDVVHRDHGEQEEQEREAEKIGQGLMEFRMD